MDQSAPQPYQFIMSNNINFDQLGIENNSNSHNEYQSENDIINGNDAKKKKKLWKPRPYQQQIYEKALCQNSIIYVETGKGKTFISIMLMANHLGIDINNRESNKNIDKKKKIIFFVCDTALINQQKKHIEEILNIEVGTIQGKKDKKSKSDYDTFIKKWESYNVFVAIPSIVYKILSCGFIRIFDISMLIFDECHHTNADHPYNKIMEEFYFFYKKDKGLENPGFTFPRIYGLTASPMKTRINGASSESAAFDTLVKLSENLDCAVIIDPEMISFDNKLINIQENDIDKNDYIEVKKHIKSEEFKKVFLELYNNFFVKFNASAFMYFSEKYEEFATKDYSDKYLDYIIKKFRVCSLENYNCVCQENSQLYNLKNFNKILYIFEKIQRHLFLILENLCLESVIIYFEELIQLYSKLLQQKKKEEEENNEISDDESSSIINRDGSEESEDEEEILSLDIEMIEQLTNIYIEIKNILKSKYEKGELYYVSDRLGKLHYTINKLFEANNKAKIIIFIANRIVAHVLNPTLQKYLNEKFKDKKCYEVIGVNNKKKSKSSITLTPTTTLKKLNEIIKKFNENEFDILIGTSAVEEGLDIQSCNAVISLVEIQTPKTYIQMKGRARKTNSRFYIFTYSEDEAKMKVKSFLQIGKKMKELFKYDIKRDFRRNNFISFKPPIFYHFDIVTHSKLTMGNVNIFFNEIKQQIETSGVKFNVKINVESIKNSNLPKYIGKLNLNTDLEGLQKYSNYTTNEMNSKDEANKMCLFYLLMALKGLKYLDHHLKFCKDRIKAKDN